MSSSDTGHQHSLFPNSAWLTSLMTFVLNECCRKPEDRLVEDLKRLALSAPHLLNDIGFELDPKTSSAVEAIWCKGSLRVAVSSQDGSVSILQR